MIGPLFAWLAPSLADAQMVATETFMVPAADPGIDLYVRNKHLEGLASFPNVRVVLFVHGATYPSESVFDIDLPGGSWAGHVSRKGYDVHLVDVRGYGGSTRSPAMERPPSENPAFATTADAVNDVRATVDFILKRRGVPLVGWSWGTAIMAGYTTAHNDKVSKLVLYALIWTMKEPPPFTGSGAYRNASREAVRARGIRGIRPQRVEEISPAAWFDVGRQATLATDPFDSKQTPPVIRAPNGVLQDVAEYWGVGKETWEPSNVRVPTLLIVAEWDRDAPLYMAQEVFTRLLALRCDRGGYPHGHSREESNAVDRSDTGLS
jgi:pimeloyl-ACP methyl ester carboxylesterase